jgi:hypothetical protein
MEYSIYFYFNCPHSQDSVVLGGTHDKDQWDLAPRKEDAKFILDGCTSLFPSLEVNAKKVAKT